MGTGVLTLRQPRALFATTHSDVRGKERWEQRLGMGMIAYLDLFLLGTAGAAAPSSPGAKQASKMHFPRLKPPAKVFLFRIGKNHNPLVLSGAGVQHRRLGPLTQEKENPFLYPSKPTPSSSAAQRHYRGFPSMSARSQHRLRWRQRFRMFSAEKLCGCQPRGGIVQIFSITPQGCARAGR